MPNGKKRYYIKSRGYDNRYEKTLKKFASIVSWHQVYNNGKLKNGDIYCIIISDNCYNIEEYLDIKEYECSHCKKIFKSSEKRVNKYYYTGMFKNDNIDKEILNEHINEIKNMRFCSKLCELEHMLTITSMLEEETNIKFNGDFTPDIFITKDTYSNNNNNNVIGYIYKISKKSTQEKSQGKQELYLYLGGGDNIYWPKDLILKNIGDYVFEIVEVISKSAYFLFHLYVHLIFLYLYYHF